MQVTRQQKIELRKQYDELTKAIRATHFQIKYNQRNIDDLQKEIDQLKKMRRDAWRKYEEAIIIE